MVYTFSIGKKKRVLQGESFQDVFNTIVRKYMYTYASGKVFLVSSNDPNIPFGTFRLSQVGYDHATTVEVSKSEIIKYEL